MYNKIYPVKSKSEAENYDIQNSSSTINISDYYSETIDYGETVSNKYTLTNPKLISTLGDNSELVGKYVLINGGNGSVRQAKYIIAVSENTMYYRLLNDGDLNITMMVGDSYTDNGDNTYTINNPTEVTYIDWYNGSYSSNKNKYVCDGKNATCSNLKHITNATQKSTYSYWGVEHKYKYAKSVSYDGTNYTLNGDVQEIWDIPNSEEREKISNHHYTCLNTGGTCKTINYIYFSRNSNSDLNYVQLIEGENIETALNNMLNADNVNQLNSIIKTGVDAWYKKYLINYSDYLEDTVFCNDRNQTNAETNGWNPNGGSISTVLQFNKNTNNHDLSCTNETDKFSLTNSKAKLTYPVALLTYPETYLLNYSTIRKTGQDYWLASPLDFPISAQEHGISSSGNYVNLFSHFTYGLRPAISLKPKSRFISGTGSTADPYIFNESNNYSIDVEINNETEDLTVEIADLSKVPAGETVNFKVTPIKGRKLTSLRILDEDNNEIDFTTLDNKNYRFIMPDSNVTIIPSYERVKNAVIVEDNQNTKEFVIEVNDSQAVVYEDTVRFKLEPEAGYEVEKIEITDDGNNKISYRKTNNINEYEFIMPDTNVLIKPFYRLIPNNNSNIPNPNTKRQILLIVISIIILGIMTFIYIKKKKHKN